MTTDNAQSLILGPIKRLYLLGGGPLLLRFAEWAKGQKLPVTIVTSPRHAAETAGGKSFEAQARNVAVKTFVVEDINKPEGRRAVAGFGADSVALSFGAAWIFGAAVIEGLFQDRLFNLHGSRLPQNRGGGGFSWQIMSGSKLGFCLLHQVDGGIDAGPVVAVREFLYPPASRIPADFQTVYEKENLAFLADLFSRVIKKKAAFPITSQPEYLSSYWPRLHTLSHSWIDWSMPVDDLDRFVCAFDDPYAGSQTLWNETPVFLKKSLTDSSDGVFHSFQYGLVYRNNGRWLTVAGNGGTLIVQSVLDADGKSVLASIKAGDRLFTPNARLEQRQKRVIYDPHGLKPTR